MSDLIPDEEQLAEANKRYPTDHEVDDPHGETGVARSDPYGYDATANEAFLEGAMWERARRVSPVTRPDIQELIAEANLHNWGADSEDYELPYRMVEALESVVSPVTREALDRLDRANADGEISYALYSELHDLVSLSASPPAEVEWEYGEFSKDDIQEDGSIHPWAEPIDTWETPLTGDELIDLADVGSVCARRVKACPWVPVKGTEK